MMLAVYFFILFLLTTPVSAQGLRDVKGPVDLPFNFVLIFGAIAAITFLAAVALFFLLKKNFSKKISILPPEPAWIVAYRRLSELKNKNLPARGEFKEFYSILSDIARRYMEERFNVRAPEMTTEEFLHYLSGAGELNSSQKQLLKDFLNSCDMVKFAKYGPTSTEAEQSFQSAERLIAETRPSEKAT